jgi:hypothetical protein
LEIMRSIVMFVAVVVVDDDDVNVNGVVVLL